MGWPSTSISRSSTHVLPVSARKNPKTGRWAERHADPAEHGAHVRDGRDCQYTALGRVPPKAPDTRRARKALIGSPEIARFPRRIT